MQRSLLTNYNALFHCTRKTNYIWSRNGVFQFRKLETKTPLSSMSKISYSLQHSKFSTVASDLTLDFVIGTLPNRTKLK
jgi:hypothetical protein